MNHQLNEEACPVSENLLGELYRASAQRLEALIETVPEPVRAVLAHYCYRRAHLSSVGLAIAASCEREDLIAVGNHGGDALYWRSRQFDEPPPVRYYERRRTVTLATAATMHLITQDLS